MIIQQLMGVTFYTPALLVVIILVVDVLYGVSIPRIRVATEGGDTLNEKSKQTVVE